MLLTDLIVKTTLKNNTPYGCIGNQVWDTQDRVFIESISEFEASADSDDNLNRSYPTGFGIINQAIKYNNHFDLNWKLIENKSALHKSPCNICLRSNHENKIAICNNEGTLEYVKPNEQGEELAMRPCMNLSVRAYLRIIKSLKENGYCGSEFQINSNSKWNKPFMKLGEYPQVHACRNTTFYQELYSDYCDLEKEEQIKKGDLIPTGRLFTGSFIDGKLFRYGVEYEYNINWPIKLVRYRCDERNIAYWFDVEPILWDILNWDDLPTAINPQGTGRADVIKLKAQQGLISGIPVHIDPKNPDAYLWQNSSQRGYLNGYDMGSIKNRSNLEHVTLSGGNFTQHNFLNEAMGRAQELIRDIKLFKTNKKNEQISTNHQALKHHKSILIAEQGLMF